jgi:hypothetical protein
MTADLVFALEAAKFASREVYGVRRQEPKEDELMKLLNKQMIIQVLSDDSCLEELTTDEQASLSGILTLKS